MKGKKPLIIAGVILLFVLGIAGIFGIYLVYSTFFLARPVKENIENVEEKSTDDAKSTNPITNKFAEVKIEDIKVTPKLSAYKIEGDLSNISNKKRYNFDKATEKMLAQNNFVVVDGSNKSVSGNTYLLNDQLREEFFPIYEENRYEDIPSFITTDSILHTYHLFFDSALRNLEQAIFMEKIQSFSNYMFEGSKKQYEMYKDDKEFGLAAKRNVGFFAVALKLSGKDIVVPDYIKTEVDQEIELIKNAQGIVPSTLMNIGSSADITEANKEDYTQYIPRGHYTKNETLKKYFKTMMWYGRITFRASNDSEALSTLLINDLISKDKPSIQNWSDVYDATSFFVGASDDITIYEVFPLITPIYPEGLTTDSTKAKEFIAEFKKLKGPKINSVPVFNKDINPDLDKEIKGFRMMGQRYTLDADIFQRLIEREVPQRMLPKALDINAAMGSDLAFELLKKSGDTEYQNYIENMSKLKSTIQAYTPDTWTQNLYWGWLYTIKPFNAETSQGYPSFMTNKAWAYKDLNTAQGSWTELKHDTILYAKQVYAEMGDMGPGGTPVDLDDRGYVEPRPEVYQRLEALSQATLDGLNSRNLLNSSFEYEEHNTMCDESPDVPAEWCTIKIQFDGKILKDSLGELVKLSGSLKDISIKELNNESLTEDEYKLISEYGGQLEHMWRTSNNQEGHIADGLDKNPVMLVSDVATDPNGGVLEEATGRVMDIYVIIRVPGEKEDYYRLARGSVWSQYEFTHPMNDRLTDEKWQKMVRDNSVPEQANWKNEYISKNASIKIAPQPLSYEDAFSEYYTLENAKEECTISGGKFIECGNACPENKPNCDKKCVQICTYYEN